MRCRRLFLLFLTLSIVAAGVWVWTMAAEGQAHYVPDYEREDLAPLLKLEGRELTEEDYRRLFLQTGLAKAGVVGLYETGRQELLLDLQERFFAKAQVECRHVNLLLRSERLVEKEKPELDFLPVLQDGDILVTFSGHVFGWRTGHAAVVVKASEGQTLEAVTYGCDSSVRSVEHWREYPGFALLRLKGITDGQQAEIAEYARTELVGVPYSLFAYTDFSLAASIGAADGVGKPLNTRRLPDSDRLADTAEEIPSLSVTQCAHLVWSVYRHFGYDLDSDGGAVVTPGDIFRSDQLEVVQIYGINPENIINL